MNEISVKITRAFFYAFLSGLFFGLWKENVYAGLFLFVITYIAIIRLSE